MRSNFFICSAVRFARNIRATLIKLTAYRQLTPKFSDEEIRHVLVLQCVATT